MTGGLMMSILAATMTLGSLTLAGAAEVTLCAGREKGGYDTVMRSIGAELANKGSDVTIVNLGGSEDILNGLADGKCSYGPAQKDIHYKMVKDNASLVSGAVPLAVLYNEAITLVCSKASGYDELEDIAEGDSIIVDVIGSGSALTWDNIVAIEREYGGGDSWSGATPVYTPLDEAGAVLGLGQAKCAFGVGKVPIAWASDIEKLGGTVSEVYDKDINDLEFNDTPLYEPAEMPDGAYATSYDTYKVPAVLFRGGKFKDAEVDRLVKRLAPSLGQKQNTIQ